MVTALISLFCLVATSTKSKFRNYKPPFSRSKGDRLLDLYTGFGRELASSDFHPFVIKGDFQDLKNFEGYQQKHIDFITNKLAPSILKYLSKTIKVQGSPKNTIPSIEDENTCVDIELPARLFDVEHEADLVLYFLLKNDDPTAVAYAAPCRPHPTTGRPVLGVVVFNPDYVDDDKRIFHDQYATILHEIYHVLVFHDFLFQFFVNPETNVEKAFEDTLIQTEHVKFPYQIIAPLTLQAAKDHYGCSSYEGIPVENSDEQLGAHWEKVIFGNDFMVSDQVANAVVSKITLSLLEDSGWYKVDYDMAEPFFWGKDAGCDMVKAGECTIHGNTCATEDSRGCFYDFTFQAFCGKEPAANDCQLFFSHDLKRHDCRYKENRDISSDSLNEYFGIGSRCLEGNIKDGGDTAHQHFCYKTTCNDSDQVQIEYDGETLTCTSSGLKLKIKGTQDEFFTCPDIEKFCLQEKARCKNECNLNGRCLVGNKCFCYPGFKGDDCGTKDTETGGSSKMLATFLLVALGLNMIK